MHLVAQVQEIEENPAGVARMKNWSMTACCYGGASRTHIYETDVWPSKGHHIRLNRAFHSKLVWWLTFTAEWNGITIMSRMVHTPPENIGVHSCRGLGGKGGVEIVGKSTTQRRTWTLAWRRNWVGCWSFNGNGKLLSFNWISGVLGCCSFDWISGLLSILSYKECAYIHLSMVYVRYLASRLAHGRVDHVSTAWCLPPRQFGGEGGQRSPPLLPPPHPP